jgi:hypothetical protein
MGTSSLNPGVGPTNADIATAVAAPSAATIAAAVAAPSSATIASAVAAAVPTISAINSSVASNAPSPNAWTVISTVTANGTVSSYTFSSLSGYKSYRIVCGVTMAVGASMCLRFNGDLGTNYTFGHIRGQTDFTYGTGGERDSKIPLGTDMSSSNAQYSSIDVIIQNATLAVNKSVKGNAYGRGTNNSGMFVDFGGQWLNTSSINSITFFTSPAYNFNNGNITLLGAN